MNPDDKSKQALVQAARLVQAAKQKIERTTLQVEEMREALRQADLRARERRLIDDCVYGFARRPALGQVLRRAS